jgi:hypothetical protein
MREVELMKEHGIRDLFRALNMTSDGQDDYTPMTCEQRLDLAL